MMTFDELRKAATSDLTIGDELDHESKDLPRKKAQWSEWISIMALDVKRAEIALNKITRTKFEYYYTEYDVKLDKKEIREVYIPGDDAVIDAQGKVEVAVQKLEFAERTLKSLIAAGFDIKNIIEYRKFMSGIL